MKKIRIGFVVFWGHFVQDEFIGTVALRRNYDVEIMMDAKDADYVFYSVMGDKRWFLPPEKIKFSILVRTCVLILMFATMLSAYRMQS